MGFTPNLVVGVAITLLGALLLLDRLDVLEARSLLQYWPVLLTLFGASVIVQALRGDAAPPSGERGRPVVGPGVVLFWVILWLVASQASASRFRATGTLGDPQLSLVGIMGQDSRASAATSFRTAEMTSVMGRTRLDLRKATLAPDEEATIDVLGVMGAVEVVVPESWTVEVQTTTVMGGVRDRRGATDHDVPGTPGPPAGGGPRLLLRGIIVAGGLIIRS